MNHPAHVISSPRIIAIARWIDAYVGFIVCMILSGAHYFFKKNQPDECDNPKHILIMKYWEAGCIILAGSCFKALRQKYPNAKITFLTLSANKEICEMLDIADEIVVLDLHKGIAPFVCQLMHLLPCLRGRHFDLLFDLEFLSRFSAIATFIIAPRLSYGFTSPLYWRGNFHTNPVFFEPDMHVKKNFSNIFQKADVNCSEDDLCSLRFIEDGIKDLINEAYVVVNVNRNPHLWQRCWPQEYYQELTAYLAQHTKFKIVLISHAHETGWTDKQYSGTIINLCGKLSLIQLAGLLKHARFFITHDSGPLHLAAAFDTPVVVFFGPESPARYGPRDNKHLVFYKQLSCSPCINVYNNKKIICVRQTNECITSITVDEVIKGMEEKGFL